MAAATDVQVQAFVNNRVRPRCNAIYQLLVLMQQDESQIGDVYSAVTEQNPTWSDNSTSGPPHLAVPGDVVNYNAFLVSIIADITGHASWPVIQNLCSQNVVGQ